MPVFNAGAIEATARVGKAEFRRDIREMQRELRDLKNTKVTIPAELQLRGLKAQLREAKAAVASDTVKIPATLDFRKARQDLDKFQTYIKSLGALTLNIKGNTAQLRKDVAEARRYVRGLAPTQLPVGANTAQAKRDVRALMLLIGRNKANIDVDADVLKALADMARADAARRRLDGSRADVTVAADGTRALGIISLVIAGISSIAYMAPAAGAALAGMFASIGVVGQGAAATAVGLSGIGDALKAMQQEEDKTATATTKATKDITSQLRAREDAYRNVGRVSIQSKQQMEDATRQVIDAERALGKAVDESSEHISSAERSVARTQRAVIQVQNELNRARKEAAEYNEDLVDSLQDAQMSEEEALLDLNDAVRNLQAAQAAGITGEDLQRIDLAARRAEEAYDQAQKSTKRLTVEQDEANRKGIEGSDQVVAAKERVYDANEAVGDAERALTEARETGLESVQSAERALEQARIQAARTQQQIQWAQEDANRQVIESQEDLVKALNNTGTAADSAGKKADLAMSKLTPAGRSFVLFLKNEAIPVLRSVRDETQSAMLPGVEVGLRKLLSLQPEIQAGLSGTGAVIGRLTNAGADMVTSGPWRKDFATILKSNNDMLFEGGTAGLALADATRSIYVESLPVQKMFVDWLRDSTNLFNEWIQGKRTSGELAEFFQLAAQRGKELWDLFVNLATTAYDLGVALAPVGETVVDIVNAVADFISWLSQLNPQLLQVIAYGALAYGAFTNIGRAVNALGSSTSNARAGWEKLLGLFGITGDRVNRATQSVTGMSNATGKVGNVLSKVGSALPVVGVAVIGLGLAYDAASTSMDEATKSLQKGGAAAAQTLRDLKDAEAEAERHSFGNWIGWISEKLGLAQPKLADVTEELNKQKAAMDPLSRAQAEVARTQNDYLYAVQQWGEGSPAAIKAQQEYGYWTGQVADQQNNLKYGLDGATNSLIRQRDQMLGSLDAEIRFKDLTAQLTQGIQDHGASIDLNTDAGRRNVGTLNDMSRAAIDNLKSMQDQGVGMDEIKRKEAEYREQLIQSAMQIGYTRDQAVDYVNKLHLIPPKIDTQVNMKVNAEDVVFTLQQMSATVSGKPVPKRALGSIDIIGMQAGGLRGAPANIANIVSPNTPTLIGDNKRFSESYIPHDPSSSRAQSIFDFTGAVLGRTVLPQGMAEGSILSDTGVFTDEVIKLREDALVPLADEVSNKTIPTLDSLKTLSGTDLVKTFRDLASSTMTNWASNNAAVTNASTGMQNSITQLMNTSNARFIGMQATIGQQTGTISNVHLVGLRNGLGVTSAAAENTSQAVAASFDRMRGYTADPIRWMIDFPFNAGLVRAWNEINAFFALNKVMKPLPRFASGGPLRGGVPGKDDIPFMGMSGEFVMPVDMVRVFGGIDNLERARRAILGGSAKGPEGMGADYLPMMAVGGAIDAAMKFARGQVGKPYVWGAVGPSAYDCSGLWSAIQNALMGRNPNARLYSTANFGPNRGAAGLVPGLKSAFTVGVQTGHMGGTLAGTAFEATPPRVLQSPAARGSTTFPWQFFLPEAGGQFIDSGPAGTFDVGAFVREKLAPVIAQANQMLSLFGGGLPTLAGNKSILDMVNAVIGWSTANILGGMTTVDASGDVVAQVKAVAKKYGWDEGKPWEDLWWIINKESSGRIDAANPNSSARGLFQKMTSIHGPVEPTATGQAEWGLRYIRDRYGNPTRARQFHEIHGYYGEGGEIKASVFDNGGKLDPYSLAYNASSRREWVMDDRQLKEVVRSGAESSGSQVVVNLHMSPGTPWQEALREAKHAWTHATRGVHNR